MTSPVEKLLDALPDAKRKGSGWIAKCPAHNDKNPSLSVSEGDDGRALIHCHTSCTTEAIVSKLGLTMRDLMPDDPGRTPRKQSTTPKARPRIFASAPEAVKHLERQRGPQSGLWTYHDGWGESVGVVVRWDKPDGKKDILPVFRNGEGWIIGGMPTPRPLYRLPELSEASRVYVTEGEKAADAVRGLGLTTTTSPHGSKSASKTDWIPLAGKDVVILPDNDEAGAKYADDVTGLLAKLSPAPKVKRVDLPDLPPGGDAVEYVAARRDAGLDDDAIRAELEGLADAAPVVEYRQPTTPTERPRAILDYRPFPIAALPEPVRTFVVKGSAAIGCDPSFVALPLLSALAAAIGNSRRIQLKRTWTEPAIVWTAIVGESGTLKTPAYKLALQPLRQRETKAMRRHAEALAEHEAETLRYEKALGEWKRDNGAQGDPPEKPEHPEPERHVVNDATVESLAPILLANPRGLLLARDELAGWIGSFDKYSAGKGADVTHWLSMHGGESLTVDRKTGQPRTIHVPSAAVSVAGGIQPGTLDRAIGQAHREDGLLGRLLLAMPPRRARRWTDAEIPPSVEASMQVVFTRLFELEPDHDDDGNPRPRDLVLSPEGRRAWITFYNAHGEEQTALTGELSAAWSKLEGYAARLALVMHAVRWAANDPTLTDSDLVDEASIGAGVVLSRWFGHEARRTYGILPESAHERGHRQLAELIRFRGGTVTIRDWQRTRSHESASVADSELAELADAGYGRLDIPVQTGRGRPSKRFILTPDSPDTDNNTAGDSESVLLSVSDVSEGSDGDTDDDGSAGGD